MLEEQLTRWLLTAQHLRNVPGRKTDVADSAWICQLVEHGLVRPSFVPPRPLRELRDLTRYRRTQAEERTRAVQRLDKLLQDAGIKLTSVASRTLTKSGRAIVRALVAGERDPDALAELALGRLRAKIPALAEALAGRFTDHHAALADQMLTHVELLERAIAQLDERIGQLLAAEDDTLALVCTIPGVGGRVAEAIVAECGLDMEVFPSAAHLASWAGICPGNDESGGKRRSGRTRSGSTWLRTALTEAAQAASRTKQTYLAAHHAQIRGRRGRHKAIGATRHDILVAYCHVVRDQVPYRELGPEWLAHRLGAEHRTRRLVRQLEQLGHQVTLAPAK